MGMRTLAVYDREGRKVREVDAVEEAGRWRFVEPLTLAEGETVWGALPTFQQAYPGWVIGDQKHADPAPLVGEFMAAANREMVERLATMSDLLLEALELLGDFADDPEAADFRKRARAALEPRSHLRSPQGADCHTD